jgi:hypothetical protein
VVSGYTTRVVAAMQPPQQGTKLQQECALLRIGLMR